MSKVANYLREHLLGEVSSYPAMRRDHRFDDGVMEMSPEMVVFPRTASDIRKVARFSWQLAEKGHVLPLTPRGAGKDATGASLSRGVIIATSKYMHTVFEHDAKQRLVRLQPGASVGMVSAALGLGGSGVPGLNGLAADATMGGAIASGYYGPAGDKYGDVAEWVSQLEVILANGDVVQTQRISKKELNRRKGLQTMEGEIYRSIDNLIDDNQELLSGMADENSYDTSGYPGLARVRRKDGSFDLTPLFIGSQGTLGIISEMIMQTDFVSFHHDTVVLAFTDKAAARDVTASIRASQPAYAEYFDGELFDLALENGKVYDWYGKEPKKYAAIIVVGYDDINAKPRQKKIAKLKKDLKEVKVQIMTASDDTEEAKLESVGNVLQAAFEPGARGDIWPEIFNDFFIPENRLEEFTKALADLAEKQHVELPLYGHILTGVYSTRVSLHLGRVGDRQKIFKLLDTLADLIEHHGGYLVANGGEGRLKTKFVQKHMDEKMLAMYAKVREIFDPHGTLNPGVKQDMDIRELAKLVKSE